MRNDKEVLLRTMELALEQPGMNKQDRTKRE